MSSFIHTTDSDWLPNMLRATATVSDIQNKDYVILGLGLRKLVKDEGKWLGHTHKIGNWFSSTNKVQLTLEQHGVEHGASTHIWIFF